jgi:hypothetical protein
MSEERRISPLYARVPTRLAASPQRPGSPSGPPPREVAEIDLELLRAGGQWSPKSVLDILGAARSAGEHLPCLLVATAILQGPAKVEEMAGRIIAVISRARPRLVQLVRDPACQARRGTLVQVYADTEVAKRESSQTKARAANDADPYVVKADGLRRFDLRVLVDACRAAILADELSHRRNARGIDFALGVTQRPPDLHFCNHWLPKMSGVKELKDHLFFWPPDWNRVVLVDREGTLVYDPAGTPVA